MSQGFESEIARATRKQKARERKFRESIVEQIHRSLKPPSKRWLWYNSHITGGEVHETHGKGSKQRNVVVNRYRLSPWVHDRSKYDGNGNKYESNKDMAGE